MQSLETQLLKTLAYVLFPNDFSTTPPRGTGDEPRTKGWQSNLDGWSRKFIWDPVVFMQHAKQSRARGCGEHGVEWRLTVWDDWTEHSAALVPDEEEKGPGPLGASVGTAAWVSLDDC